MFPEWMPRDHVRALIALKYFRPGATNGALNLEVNNSRNVRAEETRPLSAADVEAYILRGHSIDLHKSGDTVYPVMTP
ncbi:hypothetical protein O1L60_01635 [Streptomyces diastatochromogenes]|nr:hypothetical protein [Streptomyces diastatochromogenes]